MPPNNIEKTAMPSDAQLTDRQATLKSEINLKRIKIGDEGIIKQLLCHQNVVVVNSAGYVRVKEHAQRATARAGTERQRGD